MTDSLNRQRVVGIATAMYGKRWQMPLAKDLGVDTKICQRWALGLYEPSDDYVYRVEDIARRKMTAIGRELRMAGKESPA